MLQPVTLYSHMLNRCTISNHMLQPVHSIKSHVTTSAHYQITCYNQCTVFNHMLQPVHSIQSHVTISAQYPITCYNQCKLSNHMLKPVHSIQSHVLRFTLTHEDLWSRKMCLIPLQTSTPYQLTAVADTQTEQPTATCTFQQSYLQKYSVILHQKAILDRYMVLRLYTSKIISDILAKAHKFYFITQD